MKLGRRRQLGRRLDHRRHCRRRCSRIEITGTERNEKKAFIA